MAFDNTPNRLEGAFIQRDNLNQFYEQINISGSDLIVYFDSTGRITADKVSVWAALYGIGTGGGSAAATQSNYSTQSLFATSSLTASYISSSATFDAGKIYNISVSFAANGGGTPSPTTQSIYATQSRYATQSLFATTSVQANYATQSLYSTQSLYASQSLRATQSVYSTQSLFATQSKFATSSVQATSASYASSSTSASFATEIYIASASAISDPLPVLLGPFDDGGVYPGYVIAEKGRMFYQADTNTLTVTNVNGTASFATNATFPSASQVPMLALVGAKYNNVQQLQDIFHSAGWTGGGTFTTGSTSGSFYVSNGDGLIRATNNSTASIYWFSWNSASFTASANVELFVYVDYNGGNPIVTSSTVDPILTDFQTNVKLGRVYYASSSLYNKLHINPTTRPTVGDHAKLMINFNQAIMPYARESGGTIGGQNLTINLNAGAFWEGLNRFTTTAFDSTGSGRFSYFYSSASSWVEIDGNQNIDNLQYNNTASGLVGLSSSYYKVDWVYLATDSDVSVVYGQDEYSSLASASAASIPTMIPPELLTDSFLVGRVILQSGSFIFAEVESAFASTFTTLPTSDHNSLSGLQGGTSGQYYHLTAAEYTGTGTGIFVRQTGGNLTASVQGTSSYALTASVALNAGPTISASYALSASAAEWSLTADFAVVSHIADTSSFTTQSLSSSAILVQVTSSNVNYYVPFVQNSGSQTIYIDTSSIYYNPSTDLLTVTSISASSITASGFFGVGTASFASFASTSSLARTVTVVTAAAVTPLLIPLLSTSAPSAQIQYDAGLNFTWNPSSDILNVPGTITASSITASLLGTASFANTASFALNAGGGSGNATQSFYATQSLFATQSVFATQSLYSTQSLFATQSLFTTQSLFATQSVNATSSKQATSSSFSSASLSVIGFTMNSGSATTQNTVSVEVIKQVTGSFNAAFFDYVATSASCCQAGRIVAAFVSGTVEYNNITTVLIGTLDPSNTFTMEVDIATSSIRLLAHSTGGPSFFWTCKAQGRYI